MQQEPRSPSFAEQIDEGNFWIDFLVNAHAWCILPFTRKGLGDRAIGGYGVGSLLMLCLYAGFADSPEMLIYTGVWLVLVTFHSLRPDHQQHSDYQGWPFLTGWFARNEYAARTLEAFAMVGIALILAHWSEPVALFVGLGFVSLLIKGVMESTRRARMTRAARNWQLDAEAWREAMQEADRLLRK